MWWLVVAQLAWAEPEVSGRLFAGGGLALGVQGRDVGAMQIGAAAHVGGSRWQGVGTTDLVLVRDSPERGVPLLDAAVGGRFTPWRGSVVPWALADVGVAFARSGPKPIGTVGVGVALPAGDGLSVDVGAVARGLVEPRGGDVGVVTLLQVGVGL